MFRANQVRQRLDALRGRFERAPGPGSTSVDDAAERLVRAVDQHFAHQAATTATADRLVGALDVIPQGIVLADADGQVVFRNRAASGFFAARHSEALVESAIAELIAAAVQGEATTRTLDLYGPPRRALQLRAVPLEGSTGVGEGAFLVVEDVSERQRLDAVRRDFVANISHELKTPVGALGLLAETLAEETDPVVSQRLAGKMQREAFRVARTIDDLLQLSQIESSELPDREVVPVHLVLAEAVDRTRPGAELADVRLAVAEPARRLSVVGDRRQLVSAVANLCDNAVKYSDAGAEVCLSSRLEGDVVCIDVADQGIGIPARDLERVFERFYRVDRARSRDTGGTGLGLAIVRHVVANHDGEVTVTSREGEGSTFTLRLPAGPGLAALPLEPAPDVRTPAPTPEEAVS
ncbi:PAS domain-containing protein [Aquihabitans sp. G128]|uniref:sensor histidine kinase n=1 Tax=Aquihabitans sp. G128 TaxID=2849779 RepID=UPI001C23ECFF|nr:ATP-binding protein [Aquihabitans sp. G128]QXC60449.1 PAS domain-containing protein [Aquihabitans sp. G128]